VKGKKRGNGSEEGKQEEKLEGNGERIRKGSGKGRENGCGKRNWKEVENRRGQQYQMNVLRERILAH
jgi:hypothetical protein